MFDYEPGAFSYPFCATPHVFRIGIVHISFLLLHTLMFDYGPGAFTYPFCATPYNRADDSTASQLGYSSMLSYKIDRICYGMPR